MAATTKKRQEMPLNRDVLVWARKRVGLSQDEAAEGAGVDAFQIQEWEDGPKTPTVRQARKLAEVYDRPFLELLSRERPKVKPLELVPDFRMHREEAVPKDHYELLRIQSEAEEVRLNALDLFEMLGTSPPRLPPEIFGQVSDDAEKKAAQARAILRLSLEDQLGLTSKEKGQFVGVIRRQFESAGILVTKHSGLIQFGARGMCFFAEPLPIIVFSNESAAAQAFTLGHELAHVVLKLSAISGAPGSAAPSAKRIETWCDEFASAFLIPSDALAKFVTKLGSPLDSIEDAKLKELSNRFAVSRHAMLIRLVNLGYVQSAYYWGVKRPQFLEEEAAYKARGRSKYYGSRFRAWRGDLYTGLVLDAWSEGMITNHNAAEFMGIKNIEHLEAIRNRYRE
jgi:Zn-dependent peptidase ImmA (M78 family)/transcriptional regulator with XRE-family HTH domain